MTTRRLTALLFGCLLVLPGIRFLHAGGGLVVAIAVDRDPAGYTTSRTIDVSTPTSAVIAKNVGLVVDAGTPDWGRTAPDADLRLKVRSYAAGSALFVGVGPAEASR